MTPTEKAFIPEATYKTMIEHLPICTVDVLFFNEDKTKTLLFRRNNEPAKGIYYSIGGRLDKNETFLECAVRQAKRELNIDINPDRTVFGGVIKESFENSAFGEEPYSNVDLFYGYVLEDENIKLALDDQHNDYKWFSVEDQSIYPFVKSKIKQTLSALKTKHD